MTVGDTVKSYWNTGSITCDGVKTVYTLNGETIAAALGLPAGTPTVFFTKEDRGGYNQITVSVSALTGQTWTFEAANGSHWVTLASGLATDVPFLTHGIGPQVGVHNNAATSFRPFPAFRATAYRVTFSASVLNAKIHLTAECFTS